MFRVSNFAGFVLVSTIAAGSAFAASVTPPANIAEAGKITFCSDISGPPLEYYDESNVAVGSTLT